MQREEIQHEFDRVIEGDRVRQRFARYQPCWAGGKYQGQALVLVSKPGPGVFPVTVSWDY